MTWGEGHVWSRDVTAEEDSIVEFKLVVAGGNGQAQWENGDNRVITFRGAPITVNCTFGNTKAMEVIVPEMAEPAETQTEIAVASKEEAAATLAQAEKLVEELAAVKEEVMKKMEKVESDSSPLSSVDLAALESALSKAEAAPAQEIPSSPSSPASKEEEGSPIAASLVFAALVLGAAGFYLNSNPSDLSDMPALVSSLGSSLSAKTDSLVAVLNDQATTLSSASDRI